MSAAMVSPFSSTPSSYVAATGDYRIDALLWGYKFGTQPTGSPVTITYSFPGAGSVWQSGYTLYGTPGNPAFPTLPGYHGLNSTEQAAFKSALAAWSDVANITFTEVAETPTNVGDIRVAYSGPVSFTAAAGLPGVQTSTSGQYDVWLAVSSSWRFATGSNDYETLLHELGHALGLKHPFQGDVALTGEEDSENYSVMSYTFYHGAGDQTSASTPMLYDILAIQQIYGANYSTRAGHTVYTFSDRPGLKTIWDGGGIDTFDGSTLTTPVTINLNAGTFSSIGLKDVETGGLAVENIAIAFGVTIERARGGSGSDSIFGNAADNSLAGNGGNDTLDGQGGNDTLTGGAGNDVLTGGSGNDSLIGGAGNDLFVLTAGFGADRVGDFVRGQDRIDITAFGVGSLASFVITAVDGGIRVGIGTNSLTLANILGVDIGDFVGFAGSTTTPTAYADTLGGTSGNDSINGLAGSDSINGGSGNDSLTGGDGNDTLLGGNGNDTIVAGNGDDSVFGGSDVDRYDGGAGQDSITFYDSWLAGAFDLVAGTADFGGGNVRVMTGFEHLTGTWYNDRILGTAGANRLDGGQYGNDTLDGRAGDDTLTGGSGNDVFPRAASLHIRRATTR
jgi:serralysin